MDTLLGAMCIRDVDLNDATALAVFDDLNVGQRARDALAYIRKTAATPLSTRAIGLSENLRKQAGIAGLTSRQQDPVMTIR